MDMGLFFNILTVLEIIAVEFIVIWVLSAKKHCFAASVGLYAAITIPLMLFMCVGAVNLPGYGDGSGRFMVLGALYFIPALVNYGGDKKIRIIIAFYAFSYGLGGFALAVRTSYLFIDKLDFNIMVLLVQTVLYAITLPFFLKFSKNHMIPNFRKANRTQKNILIRYTIVSFFLIIAFNKTMVTDSTMGSKLLVYLFLIYFIALSYRLCMSYLKANDDMKELDEQVRMDRLTELGNRLALRIHLDQLLGERKPFYLIFMDLNHFKSINDRFGHSAGDRYLYHFSCALKDCVGKDGTCYRLSGDEFVCIAERAGMDRRIRKMMPDRIDNMDFLGVAVGMARFPDEAAGISELLDLADRRMYEYKARQAPLYTPSQAVKEKDFHID